MRNKTTKAVALALAVAIAAMGAGPALAGSYPIVDTGQNTFFDDYGPIGALSPGDAYYGQDAAYHGNSFSYTDNGDGTVSDNVTGLMWTQAVSSERSTWNEAVAGAATCDVGGYSDWRLPTIKELYSLMNFNGSSNSRTPYLNTAYFDFIWGDEVGGRQIDSQFWSSTKYVGRVFDGREAAFGVNFADGRIKGYPINGPDPDRDVHFVRYVRGNTSYGKNSFHDNGDGTVTDNATGLTWMKADSGMTMNWGEALAYAEAFEYAGHDDWRLPNAKELQSIVDYSRAPDATGSAAIDPVFSVTDIESYYWTGTTLQEGPGQGVYVAFGRAMGNMNGTFMNVHGAGAQRSDPKFGDPADYAGGRGPQGDDVRIYNYVRLVR